MHKLIALTLAIALAGCAGQAPKTEDPGHGDDHVDEGHDGHDGHDGHNGTHDDPAQPIAWQPVLVADLANGTSPLNVTFTVDAPGATGAAWELAFGEGNTTSGSELPATVMHTYGAGNHTALLTVTFEGVAKTASAAVAVVALPEPIVETYTAAVLVGAPWVLFDPTGAAPQIEVSAVAWESYENEAPNAHGHAFTVPTGAARLDIVSDQLAATGGAEHPETLYCDKGDPVAPDTDMFLFRADGTYVTGSGSCGTGEAISIDLPEAGDYVIVQLGFLGADMKVPTTVTITL